MSKRIALTAAALIALGLSAVFPRFAAAAPEKAAAGRLQVIYYYLPG